MFQVFGDESLFDKTIVYGLLALPDSNIQGANSAIQSLKVSFKIPNSAKFHAKEIFHVDTRRKSPWSILNEAQIFDFAETFIARLIGQNAIFSVGAVYRDEYPINLPAGGRFPAGKMDTKQLMALAFQGAMLPIIERLGYGNFQYYVDREKTKIPWFGKGMRTDRLYKAIIPGMRSPNNLITPQPQPDGVKPPMLLEAADLFAYICSHALSPNKCRQQERFEALFRQCQPLLAVLTYNPEERLENKIPTSILNIKHALICGDPDLREAFRSLQIGECASTLKYDQNDQPYICILVKILKGQSQKAFDSKIVYTRMFGTTQNPWMEFRFGDDPTIYMTILYNNIDPYSNLQILLGQVKELRFVLLEDNPATFREISTKDFKVQF